MHILGPTIILLSLYGIQCHFKFRNALYESKNTKIRVNIWWLFKILSEHLQNRNWEEYSCTNLPNITVNTIQITCWFHHSRFHHSIRWIENKKKSTLKICLLENTRNNIYHIENWKIINHCSFGQRARFFLCEFAEEFSIFFSQVPSFVFEMPWGCWD